MKSKNNSGFTLIELIGVVVILAIIITLGAGVYLNVQKNTLNKQYENVKIRIEAKALEYARDLGITDSLELSVQYLIDEGYIIPDDNDTIYDPRNNNSLNCYNIKTSFVNGNYEAVLSESEYKNDDGSCDTSRLNTGKIKIYCNNEECLEDKWYGYQLNLSVKGVEELTEEELDKSTFEWFNLQGFFSKEKTVVADTYNVTDTRFSVTVTTEDGKIFKAKTDIKIDKEPPSILEINNDTGWSITKKVLIKASDKSGSGVYGVYVSENASCSTNRTLYKPMSDEISITKEGTYYACAMDNVGNVSNAKSFEIINIDTAPNAPTITASDGLASGSWHPNEFDLTFHSTTTGSPVTYYYGTSPSNLTNVGSSIHLNNTTINTTYYVKACSLTGLCSSIKTYIVNKDTGKPTATVAASVNDFVRNSFNINITLKDNESGVTSYAVTTSNSMPSSWTNITGSPVNQKVVSYNITSNGNYYIWIKDAAGNTNSINYYAYYIDNEGPQIVDFVMNGWYCNSSGFGWTSTNWGMIDFTEVTETYIKITTSSSAPTSGWKSTSYSYNNLECGVTYYFWIKAVDKLGNATVYKAKTIKCNSCVVDDSDDSGSSSGGSSSGSSGSKRYDPHVITSDTKITCRSAGYSTGECNYSAQHGYVCYCCNAKDSYGNSVHWNGAGSCVT